MTTSPNLNKCAGEFTKLEYTALHIFARAIPLIDERKSGAIEAEAERSIEAARVLLDKLEKYSRNIDDPEQIEAGSVRSIEDFYAQPSK